MLAQAAQPIRLRLVLLQTVVTQHQLLQPEEVAERAKQLPPMERVLLLLLLLLLTMLLLKQPVLPQPGGQRALPCASLQLLLTRS
jgi:hypothetical protein